MSKNRNHGVFSVLLRVPVFLGLKIKYYRNTNIKSQFTFSRSKTLSRLIKKSAFVAIFFTFAFACTDSENKGGSSVKSTVSDEPTFTCKGGGYGLDVYNIGGNYFTGKLTDETKADLFAPQLMGKKTIKLFKNNGRNNANSFTHTDIQKKLDFVVWANVQTKGSGFVLDRVTIEVKDQVSSTKKRYTVNCPGKKE